MGASGPWRQVIREFRGGLKQELICWATGVLVEQTASRVQKRNIKFLFFGVKGLQIVILLFFSYYFFWKIACKSSIFYYFFSSAVTAARFLLNFWGPFLPFFLDLFSLIAFFKLRYITFFLMYVTTF